MKAVLFHKYGPPDVLQLQEVAKPVPKPHEILVKVHAATVTAGDCEMRRFQVAPWIWVPLRLYMGVFKPRVKILGQELSGRIEAVGKDVTQYQKGDRIFCSSGPRFGAYAEYKCLPGKYAIAKVPSNMSYGEAASLPTGGLNALHFIRLAQLKKGDRILINGAGGSIGTYAIQLAKHAGAIVTAIDSGDKLNMLLEAGADIVFDYRLYDFTSGNETYDVIFDIVGKGWMKGVRVLNSNGKYLIANHEVLSLIQSLWMKISSTKTVINGLAPYRLEDIQYLKELAEQGVLKAFVDKTYSLDQIVEAHHYVDSGKKKGNVIIEI